MNEASLKAKARELYRKWRDGEASGVDMLEQAIREGAAMKTEPTERATTPGRAEAEKLIRHDGNSIHWLYEPVGGFHLKSSSGADYSCARLMQDDVASLIDHHRAEAERAAIEQCIDIINTIRFAFTVDDKLSSTDLVNAVYRRHQAELTRAFRNLIPPEAK